MGLTLLKKLIMIMFVLLEMVFGTGPKPELEPEFNFSVMKTDGIKEIASMEWFYIV